MKMKAYKIHSEKVIGEQFVEKMDISPAKVSLCFKYE
jgi:hypothetical protein